MFKKSQWGTSRYVYNPNNPVGLFLIFASLAFAAVMLVLMHHQAGPFAPPSDAVLPSQSPHDVERRVPPPAEPEAEPSP